MCIILFLTLIAAKDIAQRAYAEIQDVLDSGVLLASVAVDNCNTMTGHSGGVHELLCGMIGYKCMVC